MKHDGKREEQKIFIRCNNQGAEAPTKNVISNPLVGQKSLEVEYRGQKLLPPFREIPPFVGMTCAKAS